jgi:hypothetical protein
MPNFAQLHAFMHSPSYRRPARSVPVEAIHAGAAAGARRLSRRCGFDDHYRLTDLMHDHRGACRGTGPAPDVRLVVDSPFDGHTSVVDGDDELDRDGASRRVGTISRPRLVQGHGSKALRPERRCGG